MSAVWLAAAGALCYFAFTRFSRKKGADVSATFRDKIVWITGASSGIGKGGKGRRVSELGGDGEGWMMLDTKARPWRTRCTLAEPN